MLGRSQHGFHTSDDESLCLSRTSIDGDLNLGLANHPLTEVVVVESFLAFLDLSLRKLLVEFLLIACRHIAGSVCCELHRRNFPLWVISVIVVIALNPVFFSPVDSMARIWILLGFNSGFFFHQQVSK